MGDHWLEAKEVILQPLLGHSFQGGRDAVELAGEGSLPRFPAVHTALAD